MLVLYFYGLRQVAKMQVVRLIGLALYVLGLVVIWQRDSWAETN
jgi:hypothetical protein